MASAEHMRGPDTSASSPVDQAIFEKAEIKDASTTHAQTAGYASMAEQLANGPKESLETWLQALSAFLIYAGTW